MLFLLLAGVFLAWLTVGKVYNRYWYRGLSVQLAFGDRFIYEGDTSFLKEIVINDKLLPLPALEVGFSTGRNLEFLNDARANSTSTDQCYRCDVFSFLFHQKVIRTLPFAAHKRGVYQIGGTSVMAYDFFFRSGYYMDIPQQAVLYVYPRQVDTRRITMIYQAVTGMILSRSRLYPDPFEFSGIRDYRKEDPMRHINWKASARTGKLMVNQFDSTTSISLTIIFDLEDRLILKYDNLVEETIRITSSLAALFVKNRMPFGILSNAVDDTIDAPFSMQFSADAGAIGVLNQKLACIDASKVAFSAEALLEKAAAGKKTGHTYVWISKNREERLLPALHSLSAGTNQILWVLPVDSVDAASVEPLRKRGINVIPWEI